MIRKLTGQKIIIASHNRGKLEEFGQLFSPHGVFITSSRDLRLAEPPETETTFRGNALIKAEAACKASGLIAIADDSGLCVDALEGRPGVYTADWAGQSRDWMQAMRLVEERLQAAGAKTVDSRKAQFKSTLCVMWPDGEVCYFEGEAHGHLAWPPRGPHGHGYDPMFVPDEQDAPGAKTFAELTPEAKNKISHRAKALEKLLADLF